MAISLLLKGRAVRLIGSPRIGGKRVLNHKALAPASVASQGQRPFQIFPNGRVRTIVKSVKMASFHIHTHFKSNYTPKNEKIEKTACKDVE